MKIALASVFALSVFFVSGLTATTAFGGPPGGNPPGLTEQGLTNPGFGGSPPGLQRGGGTVPIPATFFLFGGGLAGFMGWQWLGDRRRNNGDSQE